MTPKQRAMMKARAERNRNLRRSTAGQIAALTRTKAKHERARDAAQRRIDKIDKRIYNLRSRVTESRPALNWIPTTVPRGINRGE